MTSSTARRYGRVARERGERHVDRAAHRRPGAPLGQPAGAGEEELTALVHRAGQHARLLVEDPLRAVAVVHVDVHVGHALGAGVEQRADGHRGVVVDAEAGRAVGERVVQAAPGREDLVDGAVPHAHRGDDGRPAERGGGLVHAGEGRCVAPGGEPPLGGLPLDGQLRVRPVAFDRAHVGRGVHPLDLLVGGGARLEQHDVGPLEQAVRPDELGGQDAPHGRQRVLGPQVVGLERMGGHEAGTGHRPNGTRRVSGTPLPAS